MLNKPVWDSTLKVLIENNTDGNFSVNVSGYSASNILIDTFNHIEYSAIDSTLFKSLASTGGHFNYTNGTKYDIFGLSGANDGGIEIWDSSYKSNTFITYYGWFNASYVTNWSMYDIIIFDDENPSSVSDVLNDTTAKGTRLFCYIAVADYNNTEGWTTAKKSEVDSCLALNSSTRLHVFIDGLDYGVAGTNFSSRMKDLVDYIKIEKDRDVGLNTYTAYQDFCSWSKPDGFCMRESCVKRWNGASSSNPDNYTWENWTLELEKSAWFNSHGVQVLCQSFENRTTIDNSFRISNYTILQDSYFASLVLGYTDFYMSQPDFNYAHTIYLYNVGTDLANSFSTEDNETYSRRYSNGLVYFNTTSKHGWIDDGRQFSGINLCFNLIDNSDGAGDEDSDFAFNVNGGSFYTIPATEIVWSADGNWYCENLTLTDYSNDGYYFITMKAHNRGLPADAIYISNSINQVNTGVHSFWDNTAGGEPYTWNAYAQDRNWMIDIEINQTKKSSVDTTTLINQTNTSSNDLINLSLFSSFNFDIPIWSSFIEADLTNFQNMTYYTGTSFIKIYPQNTNTCNTNNPTFNSTTINGINHQACYDSTGFKIVVPNITSSSTQLYQILSSDTTAPIITVISPTNSTYNTSTIWFNASADETISTWIVNYNGTNVTLANINTSLTVEDGTHNLFLYGNDTSGNWGLDDTIWFTVDTTSPVVTINTPLNQTYNTSSIIFNVTVTDSSGISACVYSLDNALNVSMTNITASEWNATNSSMTQGIHTVKFYCNDTAGNINGSLNRTFTIDTTAPSITILYPTDGFYSSTVTRMDYNVIEINPESCWYSINGGITNSSNYTSGNNFTGLFSLVGTNTWNVYCNDTFGNQGSATVTFTDQMNPAGSGGTTGGGGSEVSTVTNVTAIDSQICNYSYYYIVENKNNIDEFISFLKSKNFTEMQIYNQFLIDKYFYNFDKNCEKVINRTSNAEKVCNEIYIFVAFNYLNFTKSEYNEFLSGLAYNLNINVNTINEYYKNYKELCVNTKLGKEIPSNQSSEIKSLYEESKNLFMDNLIYLFFGFILITLIFVIRKVRYNYNR
ncbi:MAG TPA: hypothetical protein VGB37_00695 [Candidatus Lokiarchaeia archaeon]